MIEEDTEGSSSLPAADSLSVSSSQRSSSYGSSLADEVISGSLMAVGGGRGSSGVGMELNALLEITNRMVSCGLIVDKIS